MAVFLCNDNLITADFQNVAVKKQIDFCEPCGEKVKEAIDKIASETQKVESESDNLIPEKL